MWHDDFTVMYSNEPNKELPGYTCSSIDRSPDLQAGVVVSITAMGKQLLACLQMAISVGSTQVCYGTALVDVAIFLRNSISRKKFNRVNV